MMRKLLLLVMAASLLIFAVSVSAGEIKSKDQHKMVTKMKMPARQKLLEGDEPLPNVEYRPTTPRLAAGSPGDTVGWTQYDYQTNGSSGRRIVVDSQGGVHFAWMNGISYPSTREIYFNYVSPSPSNTWLGATSASQANGDGYVQIAISSGDSAALAFHRGGTSNTVWFALDIFSGVGVFDYFTVPNALGSARLMWPYITRDRNSRYHVVITDNTTAPRQTLGYTRSTNGGTTWSTLARVDTLTVISPVIVSSPVSDKVAIVYSHPTDTTQWKNNIYHIQSTDGVTWDWTSGKINVTHYETDNDSLWAYTDCAAVYDYNDNLHIVWNAQEIDTSGIYYDARLFHYSTGSGVITEVTRFDTSWYATGCDFSNWNFSIAKMSIGVDNVNNALFATYTSWNWGDCSTGGYANGDIFLVFSSDGGANWTLPGNLTNSHTDSCLAGDCDSDNWSSLAEKVDNNLHLFYVNDKDAGGIPQTEGEITDNPLLYLAYPNPVRFPSAPLAPELVFPPNGGTLSDTLPSVYVLFDWRDPVGVNRYICEVSANVSFSPVLMFDSSLTRSEYLSGDPLVPGQYFWRVTAANGTGFSARSVGSFVYSNGPTGCQYVIGDANNSNSFNGLDVTYSVNYFKGGNAPPFSCECTPGNTWFVSGDVNHSCSFNGLDVTFMVNYFKGGAAPLPCADCPPVP